MAKPAGSDSSQRYLGLGSIPVAPGARMGSFFDALPPAAVSASAAAPIRALDDSDDDNDESFDAASWLMSSTPSLAATSERTEGAFLNRRAGLERKRNAGSDRSASMPSGLASKPRSRIPSIEEGSEESSESRIISGDFSEFVPKGGKVKQGLPLATPMHSPTTSPHKAAPRESVNASSVGEGVFSPESTLSYSDSLSIKGSRVKNWSIKTPTNSPQLASLQASQSPPSTHLSPVSSPSSLHQPRSPVRPANLATVSPVKVHPGVGSMAMPSLPKKPSLRPRQLVFSSTPPRHPLHQRFLRSLQFEQPKVLHYQRLLIHRKGSPFSSSEASPAKKAPAKKQHSNFFETPPGSKESSPFSSPEATPTKTPSAPVGVQTPLQVREAMELINETSPSTSLTRVETQTIRTAMKTLADMGKKSPSTQEKAKQVAGRAQDIVHDKLTQGERSGSLAYHSEGVSRLTGAASWIKKDVLPSLKDAGISPLCFYNAPHVLASGKRGKDGGSLVGLHFMSKTDFDKEHICLAESMSSSNGVIGRHFSQKADAGKKAPPSKFSSFFPESCFDSFEQLMKLADASPYIARCENRGLIKLQLKDRSLYAETYLREGGMIIHDIFPLFAYLEFGKEKSYQITKDLTLTEAQILTLITAALDDVDPYTTTKDCPVRYVVKNGKQAELLIDLAPQLEDQTHIPHGIMVQISSEVFGNVSPLAQHIAEIVKYWA